jgi:hypothetical protein
MQATTALIDSPPQPQVVMPGQTDIRIANRFADGELAKHLRRG